MMKSLASCFPFLPSSLVRTVATAFLPSFLSGLLALSSCKTDEPESRQIPPDIVEPGYTDQEAAQRYEFNMVRNPVTGGIPLGSFELEQAQARAAVKIPLAQGKTTVNAYTYQGPENLGGRTRTIAYDIRYNGTTNRIILAGGISGGVFKSIDNGASWTRKSPTGDHFSCTSLAQDTRPGFQDIWYYAVGEAIGNSAGLTGASYFGNGVYKSIDNGESWTRLPASNTTPLESFSVPEDFISKVIVDPTDGNVYIACAAVIRRSTDAGITWASVLANPLSSSNQHTDIVVTSTGKLYAAFGGTNGSGVDGVWTSPPGPLSGDPGSWTRIAGAGAGGSPIGWNFESLVPGIAGSYGRVVLGITPSSENLVYAFYYSSSSPSCPAATTEADLFRWNDISGVWTDLSASLPNEPGCLSGNDPFACQTGYDLVVAVKPDDPATVYIGGTNAYRSRDSGLTWTRIGGYAGTGGYSLYTDSHPDIHALVFQPGSPLILLCGNDGGIQRTSDDLAGTVVWSQINIGYRTHQYYYVTLDPRTGNGKVMGGSQDNGTSRNTGGTGSTFEIVSGGDGVSVGLTDLILGSTYEYTGSQFGNIYRRSALLPLGFYTDITPVFANTVTSAGLFVTLFRLDPDNTERLYYANDDTLYRTTAASAVSSLSWTKMPGIATAVGVVNDITALATTRGTYSPASSSLFLGTSSGKVYRLDDPTGVAAGTGPVDITGSGFPPSAFVSSIAVNPRSDDTVLVTFSNYGVTSVWWTGDANSGSPTWTSVEGSLTAPSFRSSAIAITPAGVVYFVGTSAGLYMASGLPGVAPWTLEGATDIGTAVVSSLALRAVDNKLLVGTHGHGMWYSSLSPIPLPLTISGFQGAFRNGQAYLEWYTGSEQNSLQFELEKSADGNDFERIATIPAAGQSTSPRFYRFTDPGPFTERNYYRLRIRAMSQATQMGATLMLRASDLYPGMVVTANPFRDPLTLHFAKAPVHSLEIRMTDVTGRLVAHHQEAPDGSRQQFLIPTGSLAPGLYQIHAWADGTEYTARLLRE